MRIPRDVYKRQGLRYALNEIYGRYRIPLMVVENGLGAYDVKGEDGIVHDSSVSYTHLNRRNWITLSIMTHWAMPI